ncbi:MAG: DUF3006 domain-containing protein [Clostridia bacterium]|nr:DUF3006 domain-containing protein [Clostridia bacterium]
MIFLKYSVDRIEEGIAVCEDENGGELTVKIEELTFEVKEGDIICKTDSGFELLPDETAEKKKRMATLQKSIFTKKG